MKYLSVCSGIEAASVAWHGLGWEPVAFSEIDPFASAVLSARFPHVPNLGNMEAHASWPIEPGSIDLLVGGTPCQSFSVAGLRKGLADPRGNLALVYLAMVDRLRPRWVVWENVPGVLSSNGGRDFGAFLGGLAQLGYGFAYRVLDAQYVRVESHPRAVPQRRRRVFVVGCAGGDWRSAAEVLLEPEGVRGDLAPRREAGKAAPGGSRPGATSGGVEGVDPLPFDTTQVTHPANYPAPQPGDPCHPLARGGHAPAVAFQWPVDVADPITAVEGRTYTHEGTTFRMHNVVPDAVIGFQSNLGSQGGDVFEGVAPTVRIGSGGDNKGNPPAVCVNMEHAPHATGNANSVRLTDVSEALTRSEFKGHTAVLTPAVAFKASHYTRGKDGAPSEIVPPLSADADKGDQDTLVAAPMMAVRRLTPRECERLQGFPDDWTAIEYRGKPAADGPRYKALGNSMAVNVMRWIGERLSAVHRKT